MLTCCCGRMQAFHRQSHQCTVSRRLLFCFPNLPSSWAQRYFARTRDICCSVIGAARQGSTLPHFKKSREGRRLVKEADWPALNVTDRFVQSLFKFVWKGASPFRMGGWKQRAKCAIFFFCFSGGDLEQWCSAGGVSQSFKPINNSVTHFWVVTHLLRNTDLESILDIQLCTAAPLQNR